MNHTRASRSLHVLEHTAKLLLLASLCAAFLAGDVAKAQEKQDDLIARAKARYESGRKAFEEGKLARGRDELLAALELVPRFTDAHYLLGVLYARAERWDDALDHYTKALEIGPPDPKHYYGIGCCKRAKSDPKGAREAFDKARAGYELQLARIEASRAKHPEDAARDKAEAAFGSALVEVEVQVAATAREDGDEDAVLAACDRGLARSPDHPKLVAEKGNLQLRRGDAAAVATLETAVKLAPDDVALLYSLGRALIAAGREDEGKAKLREFKARDEERRARVFGDRRKDAAQSLAARAELELHDGHKDKARELADRSIENDPANALAKTVLEGVSR